MLCYVTVRIGCLLQSVDVSEGDTSYVIYDVEIKMRMTYCAALTDHDKSTKCLT